MGIQDLEKKKVRSTTRFSARAQLGTVWQSLREGNRK